MAEIVKVEDKKDVKVEAVKGLREVKYPKFQPHPKDAA